MLNCSSRAGSSQKCFRYAAEAQLAMGRIGLRTARDRLEDVFRAVPVAFAFLVIFSPAAIGQEVASPRDRFALYNLCAPVGLLIEGLPDDTAASGPSTVHLQAMAESRLRAVGLHGPDALTFLHVAASRDAVELRYMKPVIDVASGESEMVRTFSGSAEVRDGTAVGLLLEVSKLLDLFLSEYRRVNQPECAATNPPGSAVRERTGKGLPGEARERSAPTVIDPPPTRGETPRTEPPRTPDGIRWGPILSDPGSEDDESRVRRVSSEVSSPRLLRKVEPEYSDEARRAKLQGTVELGMEVWEDGKAHNIRVLRSVGMGLDEKAVEAVNQWVFEPGKKDGQPVRVRVEAHVSFRIVVDPRSC